MSSEWLRTTLGSVTDWKSGGTPAKDFPAYWNGDVPWISANSMYGTRYSDSDLRITEAGLANGSRLAPKDSILLLVRGSALHNRIPVGIATRDVAFNQDVKAIVAKQELISPWYLLFWLMGQEKFLLDTVVELTGIGAGKLDTKRMQGLEILLPPRNEQDSIITIVKAIDDRIILLRETNATLEAIAQALFKSWFVDFDPAHAKQQGIAPEGLDEATAALFPDSFEESELGLVPRGWKVHRLGEVTKLITKGTTPTTLKRPFVAVGINFVKAESMTNDGGFIPEKFAFIDSETHELLRRSQLEIGDVLISIAGTIGRIAVVTEDVVPANTNQAVALIRPMQEFFPSGLVSRFLQRSESQQLMTERVVQAVQANLSLGTLSALKLVLPPPDVTCQLYNTGLAQIDATITLNHRRISSLATLRDTLLPRLISGQLHLPAAEVVLEEVEA